MNENNLKLAQQDIEEALQAVTSLEECIDKDELPKDLLKEKFLTLSEKVQALEDILKTEGII